MRGRIEAVLNAAAAKGQRSGENPARWVGNLKDLLPARLKLSRGHHAALPRKDLPVFMAASRDLDGISPRALLCSDQDIAASHLAGDQFEKDQAAQKRPSRPYRI